MSVQFHKVVPVNAPIDGQNVPPRAQEPIRLQNVPEGHVPDGMEDDGMVDVPLNDPSEEPPNIAPNDVPPNVENPVRRVSSVPLVPVPPRSVSNQTLLARGLRKCCNEHRKLTVGLLAGGFVAILIGYREPLMHFVTQFPNWLKK